MKQHNPEQPAQWYDDHYDSAILPQRHYAASKYYFLWALVASKILSLGPRPKHVLDLGCGTGQFGALLWDQGVTGYTGVDFSYEAIRLANRALPEHYFLIQGNLLVASWPRDYDCVVLIETLEHIERDMAVLAKIKPGVPVVLTVPDFASESHVRYFENEIDVADRYEDLFWSGVYVERWKCKRDASFFILQGVKK